MARSRGIKPSFFQHDVLGEIEPLARLLFIGMWTVADFKGCLEYRPKRIKAQLLPYDSVDISELVRQLDESGLIAIYSVQGTAYIKVLNFEKHQNPHKNERDAGTDNPDIDHDLAQVVDSKGIAKNREQDGTTPAVSLFPLPSSLNLNPDSNLCEGASPPPQPAKEKTTKVRKEKKEPSQSLATWEAYRSAYVGRYGVEPVRNATTNGQIAQFVSRIGVDEAPMVAQFYVNHQEAFYNRGAHAIGFMLKDAEKLRMEWATGRTVAVQQSRQMPSMKSFAEQDRDHQMARWEEMTGRTHPDRQKTSGNHVIDITPSQNSGLFLEN